MGRSYYVELLQDRLERSLELSASTVQTRGLPNSPDRSTDAWFSPLNV